MIFDHPEQSGEAMSGQRTHDGHEPHGNLVEVSDPRDPFALLGAGRGSDPPWEDSPQELSPVRRARGLLNWARGLDGNWNAQDEYRAAAAAVASELGLEIAHGRWHEWSDGHAEIDLVAVYCDAELIGFVWVDPDDEADRLLIFDHPERSSR